MLGQVEEDHIIHIFFFFSSDGRGYVCLLRIEFGWIFEECKDDVVWLAAADHMVVKVLKVVFNVVNFWLQGVYSVCIAEGKTGQHAIWVWWVGWDLQVEVKRVFVEARENFVVPYLYDQIHVVKARDGLIDVPI